MSRPSNDLHYDWFWLLTWTTYGSWLPGDDRGSIGILHDQDHQKTEYNKFGEPAADPSEALAKYAKDQMKGNEQRLVLDQARVLLTQFHCTSAFRKWRLLAVSIMANHIHLVVNVHSGPEPDSILRDFKSYGSGALNVQWGEQKSGTWWTKSGSKRKLGTDNSVISAIEYCCDQKYPLLIWTKEEGMFFPKSNP